MEVLILKSIIYAYVLTQFQPLKWIIDLIPNSIPKYIIVLLTSCLACASFWIALVLTHSLFVAGITYFIISQLNKLWTSIEPVVFHKLYKNINR
jgi:hypothetical protein